MTSDPQLLWKQKLDRILDRIVQSLIEAYAPERVILFGSLATGNTNEWSDIDLVIIKDTNRRFLDRLKEVARICHAPISVDYLVYTPQEFKEMLASGNSFLCQEIMQKGKVLYERPTVSRVV